MSGFLGWLYSTIPFIQLLGNRFNVLGFFWFTFLTLLTLKCISDSDYSFGARSKRIHNVGITAISIFSVWVFYRSLDEILTIMTVLSLNPTLLQFSSDFVMFWFGKILSYSIVILGINYLFIFLKLKRFFKLRTISKPIFPFVAFVQYWSVGVFKSDYAVLTGSERISVFWMFYPILYVSYSILYLTLFNWRNV